MKANFILLILLTLFFENYSYSLWMTREDTTHDINFYNKNIEINSDGTYTEITEAEVTLTKDDQKENIVTDPIEYYPNTEKLTVIRAYTIFDGKKFIVKRTDIEDKSIANNLQGFNNVNQVSVKFSNVKKGAKLYIKTKLKVNKVLIKNLFSKYYIYEMYGYLKSSNIKLTSKIPLYFEKNDPENILNIKNRKISGNQIIEININKPFIKNVTNERNSFLNYTKIPWIAISTYNDWKKLSQIPIKKYEDILNQKLPDIFESIAQEASKKPTLNEQIDTITSRLAEKIKYMGDWRSLESNIFPKNLSDISYTGQGDCKDYAISTVAILRRIGIPSNVSIIYLGEYHRDLQTSLPNLTLFNHMIVQIKKDRKTLWIDPTHYASYSNGIFSDISDRKVLVFNPENPDIEMTPALKPTDSQIEIYETLDYSVKDQLIKEGIVNFKGNSAIFFAGASLRLSKELLDQQLLGYITSNFDNVLSVKFDDYDLNSRIVTDKTFKYSIIEKPNEIKTDLGIGYSLDLISKINFYTNIFLINTLNRKSDLLITSPEKFKSKILLKNVFRSKKTYTGCQIKSKWGSFTRIINDQKNGVEINDEAEITQFHILNNEILSDEFNEFQKQIESCIRGIVIISSSDKYIE